MNKWLNKKIMTRNLRKDISKSKDIVSSPILFGALL